MRIKVCGMKDPENIRQLASLKIDYIGLIFYEGSKRYVGGEVVDMRHLIPYPTKLTGVFVNEETDRIVDLVMNYKLDAVQLHGQESPADCRLLKQLLHDFNTDHPVTIIKAFGIDQHFDFNLPDKYADVADLFLFDTSSVDHGGSGVTFDWELLKEYQGLTPFFLSGGIGLEEILKLKEWRHPKLYGLDLNSRFEHAPGDKDVELLKIALTEISNKNY